MKEIEGESLEQRSRIKKGQGPLWAVKPLTMILQEYGGLTLDGLEWYAYLCLFLTCMWFLVTSTVCIWSCSWYSHVQEMVKNGIKIADLWQGYPFELSEAGYSLQMIVKRY